MTAITRFDFRGQPFRAIDLDGETWFVASDVLASLDLNRSSVALLDEDEKGVHTMDTLGGGQQVSIVSEPGLFSLILRSRKPEAKAFKRWITHEVLPTIRRTGSYGQPAPVELPSMKQLAEMVIQAETARELAEARVAELEPKAEVADRLLNAEGDLSVADTAKELTRAGIKVGEGRLFAALFARHWIYRAPGDGKWRVYQSAIESGVMSVLPMSHYHPKTGVLVLDPPQPRVTPKGLQKLLADHGAVSVEPAFAGASS